MWLTDNEILFNDYGDLYSYNIKEDLLKKIYSKGGTSDEGNPTKGYPQTILKIKDLKEDGIIFRYYPSFYDESVYTYYKYVIQK